MRSLCSIPRVKPVRVEHSGNTGNAPSSQNVDPKLTGEVDQRETNCQASLRIFRKQEYHRYKMPLAFKVSPIVTKSCTIITINSNDHCRVTLVGNV